VNAATPREPGFLDDVVHPIAAPGTEQAHDDHAQSRRMPDVQLAERTLVSPEESTDQRRVSEIGQEAVSRHIS